MILPLQDVTFSIGSDENQQICVFDHVVSAWNFGVPTETAFEMDDSATDNIAHSCENLRVQGINEVNGNELVLEENEIDNAEGNGSDQESGTDSENESDDEHEDANDEELFEVDPLDQQPSLHVDGPHQIDGPIGQPNC